MPELDVCKVRESQVDKWKVSSAETKKFTKDLFQEAQRSVLVRVKRQEGNSRDFKASVNLMEELLEEIKDIINETKVPQKKSIKVVSSDQVKYLRRKREFIGEKKKVLTRHLDDLKNINRSVDDGPENTSSEGEL